MKLFRFRVRTLLILVAIAALLIEAVGLGWRSRRYAAQVQVATAAERVNLAVAQNSRIAATQENAEADRIARSDPAKATKLRAHAEMLIKNIPFHEKQAQTAALKRQVFERALTHPWEGDPPNAREIGNHPANAVKWSAPEFRHESSEAVLASAHDQRGRKTAGETLKYLASLTD